MKKTKKILVGILIFIFVVGLIFYFVNIKKNKKINANLQVSNYTVKKEIVENNIEISGNIEAAEIQTLQAQGDGTVRKVFFKEGDYVKKGQVILQLDSDEEDYNIQKHDYDYEQKKIIGAAKELEILRQQREMLIKKLEKRQVIARINGILVDLDAAENDYFEAASTVGSIVDRTYLKAKVEVVENDAPKLKIGQIVKMRFPAYSKEIEGKIYSCPNVARITSRGASVVDAEIRVENPPEEILPNFSFTGKIQITAPEEILIVEKNAIIREGKNTYVQKINGEDKDEKIIVEVVPYDIDYVKIISGLNEGDILKAQKRELSGKNAKALNKNSNGMNQKNGNIPPMMGGQRF